jgi:hypothetical protein
MAVTEALEGGAAGDACGHSTEHVLILCPEKRAWEVANGLYSQTYAVRVLRVSQLFEEIGVSRSVYRQMSCRKSNFLTVLLRAG